MIRAVDSGLLSGSFLTRTGMTGLPASISFRVAVSRATNCPALNSWIQLATCSGLGCAGIAAVSVGESGVVGVSWPESAADIKTLARKQLNRSKFGIYRISRSGSRSMCQPVQARLLGTVCHRSDCMILAHWSSFRTTLSSERFEGTGWFWPRNKLP